MEKTKADKILCVTTSVVNMAALAVVLAVGFDRSLYGTEFLLWGLLLAAPLSALWALWRPGREERRLRRRVAVAELRRRLKELGEEAP